MMPTGVFPYADERFADLQMLRYEVPGFSDLSIRQKLLVYHLSEAALWGRDILWDQNGCYNLRIRTLLEHIYTSYKGKRDEEEFLHFETYLKRVWFSNGIHHHYGCQKFQPAFSQAFFRQLLLCLPPQEREDAEELIPILFDPKILSMRVNQEDGVDLVQTSSCNYYASDVTQKEAEEFYAALKQEAEDKERPVMFGMNSRLEKKDGKLVENVWKSGGMYGKAIEAIVKELQKAIPYAENEKQKEVIEKLVEFYQTGNLKTFDLYSILWVSETEGEIDFTNCFTEVYGDPLGLKASWEGYVNFTDFAQTKRTQILSGNAQWFEDHSPISPGFRKKNCQGVSARVVTAAILGGDLYPSSAIGINLPNSNWIRAEYGSKSVTISNLTHAYAQAAKGNGMREEFVPDEDTRFLLEKYGEICDNLHTDLHECLGHGSGRIRPEVDPDALKAYGSTIEETRADLFGLYFLADHKLIELGLIPHEEAYKAGYYSYMLNGLLTQLVRLEPGQKIEEAHMRNRSLIAHWVLAHYPEAVSLGKKDGKTVVEIKDYPTLREAFGKLLHEIQRIKSEGDFCAARDMVESYGIAVDPALHQEMLTRYKALNLAPYKGFINPRYTLVHDTAGNVMDVTISYEESYAQQMLRYSNEYATLTSTDQA